MKKVSIIVPVYNAEKYLEKTIESILNQTLEEIEIILINDGSIDGSEQIIQKYLILHPEKIKTETIENQGPANARNIGLQLAQGEYIGFVDSDDYIERDMFKKLYNKAKFNNADICVCGYFVEREKDIREKQIGDINQYHKSIYENPNLFVYGVPYIWNKIFRREMIQNNNISFNDMKIFEDLEFTYKAFLNANKIEKVNEPLYYYKKENENSLTSKFSNKFFQIFIAIKNLKEYCIEKEIYEQMKPYIMFVALNHIHLRFGMRVKGLKQKKLKCEYINQSFMFLDKEFPNWKSDNYYYQYTKRNRKIYTKKLYAKMNAYINIGSFYKKIRKVPFTIKNMKESNLGHDYLKYTKKFDIVENRILLDSQHGNDINGNIFYILKELNDNSNYKEYEIYLSVCANRKLEFEKKLQQYQISHVKLIVEKTKEHAKILATAKFLFSDTSFPSYYIKRKGQVYLNTWHGTPLKTLGKSTKGDFYTIGNLQKNFVIADYLLYPNEFMMEHMIEDYMINNIAKNKILLCGYPRNSIFFDKERENYLKRKLKIEDKTIITYMPTWRGLLYQQDIDNYVQKLQDDLKELEEKLTKDQVLYVNVHPYVKDFVKLENMNHIYSFPKEYETYDFLNISDILITDYSSVFFDFAIKNKKIILYTYDQQEYFEERGVYINLEELPFAKVNTVEDVVKEINKEEKVNYIEFKQKYCTYEEENISKKICEKIVLNLENDLIVKNMPNNKKENILIFLNNFANKYTNQEFFDIIQNTKDFPYNYYIGYNQKNIIDYQYNLNKLPNNICYLGGLGYFSNASYIKKIITYLLKNKIELIGKFTKIVNNERKRLYDDICFEKILMFQENNVFIINMFQDENIDRICYSKNSKLQKKIKYDKKIEKICANTDINALLKIEEE